MLEETLHARQLRCRVVADETTAASKRQMIERLAVAFERGEITLLADPVLVNEFDLYAAEATVGGSERFGAPVGFHDDCVMACALAWSEVQAGRRDPRGWYPNAQQIQESFAAD